MNLVLTPETWQPGHLRLQLAGRLDSESAPQLESMLLAQLQEQGRQAVVLDCSELNYIASAGLRVLLMAAKRAGPAGARFIVCGLQPQVREVFAVSGFLKILSVADDFEQAQAALAA